MLNEYRLVVITPVSHGTYLSALIPQIVSCPLLDEYQLWLHAPSDDCGSLAGDLQHRYARVRVIEPRFRPTHYFSELARALRHCADPRTVYVYVTEDIIFAEPGFLAGIAAFRLENPGFFMVYANVVNNAVCTYLHALHGAIKPEIRLHPCCSDSVASGNGRFAEQLHRALLSAVQDGGLGLWHFAPKVVAMNCIAVDCVSWMGSDAGVVPSHLDAPEWIGAVRPAQLGRVNCIYGDKVLSRYAYPPQRQHLDSTDILDSYASLNRIGQDRVCPVRKSTPKSFWTPRLLKSLDDLRIATVDQLQQAEYLQAIIRAAGLVYDEKQPYGADAQFMNPGREGLWQIPAQLARCLLHLRQFRIRTVVEIGTWTGWTICIIAAYLLRFNPDFHVLTVDIANGFRAYSQVRELLPVRFRLGHSRTFADQQFDLAIIDGDHAYESCMADYQAVGRSAGICMFHDINDKFVAARCEHHGGVPRAWQELKGNLAPGEEALEFLDHPNADAVMGIGLIVRAASLAGDPTRPKAVAALERT
jgi:hypothetical protein